MNTPQMGTGCPPPGAKHYIAAVHTVIPRGKRYFFVVGKGGISHFIVSVRRYIQISALDPYEPKYSVSLIIPKSDKKAIAKIEAVQGTGRNEKFINRLSGAYYL